METVCFTELWQCKKKIRGGRAGWNASFVGELENQDRMQLALFSAEIWVWGIQSFFFLFFWFWQASFAIVSLEIEFTWCTHWFFTAWTWWRAWRCMHRNMEVVWHVVRCSCNFPVDGLCLGRLFALVSTQLTYPSQCKLAAVDTKTHGRRARPSGASLLLFLTDSCSHVAVLVCRHSPTLTTWMRQARILNDFFEHSCCGFVVPVLHCIISTSWRCKIRHKLGRHTWLYAIVLILVM